MSGRSDCEVVSQYDYLANSRIAPCKLQRFNYRFLQVATWLDVTCFENQIISQSSSWHFACDASCHESFFSRSKRMADVIFILLTVVFFIISWLYVRGCDRL